ncbi:MAG TPA: hypothetical protein VGB25_11225 [Candidatus Binatia bacterium]
MSSASDSSPGKTRSCPHCKSTILESAAACPQCQHYIRSDAIGLGPQPTYVYQPLRVEGTVQHPALNRPSEYSVILTVHDENGAEISRRVMAVGAIAPSNTQKFTVWVEVYN